MSDALIAAALPSDLALRPAFEACACGVLVCVRVDQQARGWHMLSEPVSCCLGVRHGCGEAVQPWQEVMDGAL